MIMYFLVGHDLLHLKPYSLFLCIVGPPGPVTNINSFNDSCNTIGISWTSPIGNDVEYYNLRIINSLDGTLLNNTLVYSNSYQFENVNLLISHYTFDITGVNQFGEGVSNSVNFSFLKGIVLFNI